MTATTNEGRTADLTTANMAGRAGWDTSEYKGRDGLDTTLGRAALYTRVPSWHGLGFVDEAGEITDPEALLDKAGCNWDVEKRPVHYYTSDGTLQTFDDKYVNVRTDTGAALGVVGRIYQPFQNRMAYDFLSDILGESVVADSVGSLRGGSRVFMSVRLPEHVTFDPEGIADDFQVFLALTNGHDGESPFTAVVTPWRPVCGNSERFMLRDAKYRWTIRHTRGGLDRIEEARRTLNLTSDFMKSFIADEEALLHADATAKSVDAFLDNLWPVEKGEDGEPSKRAVTYHNERIEKVKAIFGDEADRVGRNLYALERAVTGYLDNESPVRPRGALKGNEGAARGLQVMEDVYGEVKTTAHRRLMMTVKRRNK